MLAETVTQHIEIVARVVNATALAVIAAVLAAWFVTTHRNGGDR